MSYTNNQKLGTLESERARIEVDLMMLESEIDGLEAHCNSSLSNAHSIGYDIENLKNSPIFRERDEKYNEKHRIQQKLKNLDEQIKVEKDPVLKLKRLDSEYNSLVAEKNRATTETEFNSLSRRFAEMDGYKNTKTLASECESRFQSLVKERKQKEEEQKLKDKEAMYQKLLGRKVRAQTENEYYSLHGEFNQFGNYKDAMALALECNEKYKSLKSQREVREEAERTEGAIIQKAHDLAKQRFANGEKVGLFFVAIALLSIICAFIFSPIIELSPAWVLGGVVLIPFVGIFHLASFMGIINGKTFGKFVITAMMLAWIFIFTSSSATLIYEEAEQDFSIATGAEIFQQGMDEYPLFTATLAIYLLTSILATIVALYLGQLSKKVYQKFEINDAGEKLAKICEGIAILAFVVFVITNPSISFSFWWVVGGLIICGIAIFVHIAVFEGILKGGVIKRIILTALHGLIWSVALVILSGFLENVEPLLYEMVWSEHVTQIIQYYADPDFAFFAETLPVAYSTVLYMFPVFTIALTVHVFFSIFAAISAATLEDVENKISVVTVVAFLVIAIGVGSHFLWGYSDEAELTDSQAIRAHTPISPQNYLDKETTLIDFLSDFRSLFGEDIWDDTKITFGGAVTVSHSWDDENINEYGNPRLFDAISGYEILDFTNRPYLSRIHSMALIARDYLLFDYHGSIGVAIRYFFLYANGEVPYYQIFIYDDGIFRTVGEMDVWGWGTRLRVDSNGRLVAYINRGFDMIDVAVFHVTLENNEIGLERLAVLEADVHYWEALYADWISQGFNFIENPIPGRPDIYFPINTEWSQLQYRLTALITQRLFYAGLLRR